MFFLNLNNLCSIFYGYCQMVFPYNQFNTLKTIGNE